ncbi:DUF3461 family protein [Psychromonas sp. KJ10-10]|uniref:DUF3461 family protein n=1 Tax=Psychromonas sp. KJ10-10 TaxID=3391823 RepID=UPI0039B530C2
MESHLNSIGIRHLKDIIRYSLRQEGENDILKIYFKKHDRELLARSSKFKFQRQQKTVSGGARGDSVTNLSEINPKLRNIITELDALAVEAKKEKELKHQLLSDLKHLESVMTNKIKEMEETIAKL